MVEVSNAVNSSSSVRIGCENVIPGTVSFVYNHDKPENISVLGKKTRSNKILYMCTMGCSVGTKNNILDVHLMEREISQYLLSTKHMHKDTSS